MDKKLWDFKNLGKVKQELLEEKPLFDELEELPE